MFLWFLTTTLRARILCNDSHTFAPISVSLRDAIWLPRPNSMASILFLAGRKTDGASNFLQIVFPLQTRTNYRTIINLKINWLKEEKKTHFESIRTYITLTSIPQKYAKVREKNQEMYKFCTKSFVTFKVKSNSKNVCTITVQNIMAILEAKWYLITIVLITKWHNYNHNS